jgi:ADP-ribosyl-[dinitrogen reductase] hydrolase
MPSELRQHLVAFHGWEWQRVGGTVASIIHAMAHKAPIQTPDIAVSNGVTTGGGVPTELLNRYRGVMLGLAVGNSLGVELEGLPRETIRQRFPRGQFEIPPTERAGPWDDDVAQAVIIAEALIADARLDVGDLGRRLVLWAEENGRGIGNLTADVISRLANGTPATEAAREAWEESGRTSAGNGAVMRCAPVALRWQGDLDRLVAESLTSASVTHADPRCGWTAVALNLAIRELLLGRKVDLSALASMLVHAPDEVREAVTAVEGMGLDDLRLSGPDMGYTLKAMQVGLWAARTDLGSEKAIRSVVAAGGDTDTNGAIAGAVLGARFSVETLPVPWIFALHDWDRLVGIADKLAEASAASSSQPD